MPDATDLEIMMQSRVPIIVIQTYEELRALEFIKRTAIKQGKPVFRWSITEGVIRIDLESAADGELASEPEAVLALIKRATSPAVYILCDFHPYLEDQPKHVRLLKEIAMAHDSNQHWVILLSHACPVPPEIARYSAQMSLSLPSDEQLLQLVKDEAASWSYLNSGQKVKTDSRTLDKLVANLRGLTFADARRLARGAIVDDGAITASDLPSLNRAKFQLLGMEGVLSFEYDTTTFAEIGGLDSLKLWLKQRQRPFLQPSGEADIPKGLLLLGVQGGGKSLAAKAVAGVWGVPLLRLDFAALYNKFIGETEKNLRESLVLAEQLSPCVLWLDELEKALSVDHSDLGVSRRILGTLLTWMAERTQPVFLVATSNDISQLPAELIRKGRLDEIFFVDLPSLAAREDIFAIHLRKRQQASETYDLSRLALLTDGFSGAEIEQVVVTSLYSCQAEGTALDIDHMIRAISNTQPLSVVMEESIAKLRQWAQGRTVLAD